jgi:hypothetical protein
MSMFRKNEITITCRFCGKQSILQSISVDDLLEAGCSIPETMKLHHSCSRCLFHQNNASKPKTEDEKRKRSEYNKVRNAEIKEALRIFREANKQ